MSLPGNYTFVAGDDGVHTFTGGVKLVTAGLQTVSGADTADGSVKGSASVNVTAAAASALALSAPGSSIAGSALGLKLTALDPFGNTATGYVGTVKFTSSDGGSGMSLPGNYTFVAGDDGVHTFTGGVKLVTAGLQTVTGADTADGSVKGSASVNVTAAAASALALSAPGSSVAGSALGLKLTALDPFGNTATGYVGTVKFTSSDGGSGMSLPGNYTFVAGDDGVHTFTGGVTLVTAGLQTVTGADTGDGSVKGSASVNVTAAAASALALSAPGSSVAGSALGLKLTALDPFGNTATGYTGTVSFTTTDPASGASVPGNYTFVAGDDGVHTFTGGLTLVTAGLQTVGGAGAGEGSGA